jgi:hypothetical protein
MLPPITKTFLVVCLWPDLHPDYEVWLGVGRVFEDENEMLTKTFMIMKLKRLLKN